jgi:hypothetical protein
MAIKPFLIQRRMRELGRVRLGEKGPKGEPRKLATLRFTSFSKALLDVIAQQHGGTVRPWVGAPEEGAFELVSDTNQIDIILPPVYSDVDGTPTAAYSQWFEMWSAGGCARRCDGETEGITGKPCLCAAKVADDGGDARECKLTTRVSFMLPDVPDIGVWRLDTHGWNAAVELPGTLEILLLAAAEHKFIPAVLRSEPRTKKVPGEGTRRFIVPVIEMPGMTVRQLASGDIPLAINAPVRPSVAKPELPAGPATPAEPAFEHEASPAFGPAPALPAVVDFASTAQQRKLNVLVGKLRPEHVSTEQLWRGLGREPVAGADGVLHWSPLRDSLTKAEASGLIERLTALEARAGVTA